MTERQLRRLIKGEIDNILKEGYYDTYSILPAGMLNLKTGVNKYFDMNEEDKGYIELWKDDTNKYKLILTFQAPSDNYNNKYKTFKHDQTHRRLFDANIIDSVPATDYNKLISYGVSLPLYVYK